MCLLNRGHRDDVYAGSSSFADAGEAAKWRGPYLKKKVDKDPWGNSYVYKAPGAKAEYELTSLGADGKEGGDGDDADINSWE